MCFTPFLIHNTPIYKNILHVSRGKNRLFIRARWWFTGYSFGARKGYCEFKRVGLSANPKIDCVTYSRHVITLKHYKKILKKHTISLHMGWRTRSTNARGRSRKSFRGWKNLEKSNYTVRVATRQIFCDTISTHS